MAPPTAPSASPSAEMWADKYAPRTSKDLAVHKKKVDEVREWLQRADVSLQLGLPPTPRLLVLSGPSGAGKSALLRVLADELHFEVCEWVEPRSQTSSSWDDDRWREGASTSSRDDDGRPAEQAPRVAAFSDFLRVSLRTLSLCVASFSSGSSSSSASAPPPPASSSALRRRLVLLDELAPLSGLSGNDSTQRDQQIALIRRSLPSARFPIALVLSSDASSTAHHLVEALRANAPNAGQTHHATLVTEIKVNPMADTFLLRTLQHVCNQERIDVSSTELSAIVARANGDLRNAIHSLQFFGVGAAHTGRVTAAAGGTRSRSGAKRKAPGSGTIGRSNSAVAAGVAASAVREEGGDGGVFERDRFPDIFKTVGTIIHRPARRVKLLAEEPARAPTHCAPREQEQEEPQRSVPRGAEGGSYSGSRGRGDCASGDGHAASTLLTVDPDFSPEALIESSALEEASAALFLHQNYVDSFGDIDDLAAAAGCLSDAHSLVEAQKRHPERLTPLLPYVSSLAGRGVVSTNLHPAPTSFKPTTKPRVYAVEREVLERRRRAASAFLQPSIPTASSASPAGAPLSHDDTSVAEASRFSGGSVMLAAEVVPLLRLIVAPLRGGALPLAQDEHALSAEQWQSMAELTSFGRPLPPQPPPRWMGVGGGAGAGGPTVRGGPVLSAGAGLGHAHFLDDDIEDD
jgi:hypothetical protein